MNTGAKRRYNETDNWYPCVCKRWLAVTQANYGLWCGNCGGRYAVNETIKTDNGGRQWYVNPSELPGEHPTRFSDAPTKFQLDNRPPNKDDGDSIVNTSIMQKIAASGYSLSTTEPRGAVIRPSFDWVWMRVAEAVAFRGTCPRLHVGAVLVDNANQIISTGYNGAPRGLPHCTDVGCLYEGPECPECKGLSHRHTYDPMSPDVAPRDVRPCGACGATGFLHPQCKRTAHAEANAFLQAERDRLFDATLYVTHFPCSACAMLAIQAGLGRVVYREEYRSQPTIQTEVMGLLNTAGITVDRERYNEFSDTHKPTTDPTERPMGDSWGSHPQGSPGT